jgi:hypothetical protein
MWSLTLDEESEGSATHPTLSLLQGDDACELILSAAKTASGETIVARPPLTVGPSYAAEPTAFGAPPAFYLNVKRDSLVGENGFRATLIVAEDPQRVTVADSAPVSYTATSVLGARVLPPDYGVDIGSVVIEVDADGVVQAVDGYAELIAKETAGVGYAIACGKLVSFEELDASYVRHNEPLTKRIPASAFGLVGLSLGAVQVRTIIVANAEDGVRSYQALTLAFDLRGQ